METHLNWSKLSWIWHKHKINKNANRREWEDVPRANDFTLKLKSNMKEQINAIERFSYIDPADLDEPDAFIASLGKVRSTRTFKLL